MRPGIYSGGTADNFCTGPLILLLSELPINQIYTRYFWTTQVIQCQIIQLYLLNTHEYV